MTTQVRPGGSRLVGLAWVAVAALLVPILVLGVVRLEPALDARWANHPAHFWLVMGAGAAATGLGYTVAQAARRRRDVRLLLVSFAFISGAGFLGLHALATPGVLVGSNAGFEVATPVGLVLGSGFVALSAFERPALGAHVLARSRLILWALFALMVIWGVWSVVQLPPFDGSLGGRRLGAFQVGFAALGATGYAIGAYGYLRLFQRRREPLILAVTIAFGLLAEALVVLAFAVNWRVSWWEWHVLMLVAFAAITAASRREWHEERFSALYLERTLAGSREVSVLFADLQGFTPFSERTESDEVTRVLNTYYARLLPLLDDHGAEVHEIVGDAIMAVFNKYDDQPDHAWLAGRAGLALQRAASTIADGHPDWPRFRVGINSGVVTAGVIGGGRGHRKHGVVGDTVNLAARLESQAPVGEVVIGEGTADRLPPGSVVERLPPLTVKGKRDPVTAYVLRSLPTPDRADT